MSPESPNESPPSPWVEPVRFVAWARSLDRVPEGLGTEVLRHLAGALRGHEGPVPEGLRPDALSLDAAIAWSALELSRDPGGPIHASPAAVVPHVWWECTDRDAVLARLRAEAPRVLPAAVVSAVEAHALGAVQAVALIVGVEGALRECLDALLRPWSRAAPFPESLFASLWAVHHHREFALQLAEHWCRPELFALAVDPEVPVPQRVWALRHCAAKHLDPDRVEALMDDPRLQASAVEALGRAVHTPHRHHPDLPRLLDALERHGTAVAPFLPALLCHHEKAWCRAIAEVSPEDPSWSAHLAVLGELQHPAVTQRLESWWTSHPREDLAQHLCERGSTVAVDTVLEKGWVQAVPWFTDHSWSAVMARFEVHEEPHLAAWLAAHTDEIPPHAVMQQLAVDQYSRLHRGLPYDAETALFACGRDPAHPRAHQSLSDLGEFGSRLWGPALTRLAIESRRSGPELELGDAAFAALRAMSDRLKRRGVRRCSAAANLLAWVDRAEIPDPHLPRALELLLLLPEPRVPGGLSRLLRKGSVDVRKHAIRLLRYGNSGALRRALPFLDDPDPKLQRAALDALAGRSGFEEAVVPRLRARNMNVRRTAAKALAASTDPTVVDALVDAVCSHDNRGFQQECSQAAGHIAGPAIWTRIRENDSVQARQAWREHHEEPSFTAGEEPVGLPALAAARALSLDTDAIERLTEVGALGFPFTREERRLATDPRTRDVWLHGLADRFTEDEVVSDDCVALLRSRHATRAIDRLLRDGRELEALEGAKVEQVRSRWRGSDDTLALLRTVGSRALGWRWDLGDLSPRQLVALLGGRPEERDFAVKALRTTPSAEEALIPLLLGPPQAARAAAGLIWPGATAAGRAALVDAFLRRKIDTAPSLPSPEGIPDLVAPLDRRLALLMRSQGTPEQHLDALEALAARDEGDNAGAFASAYARLPVALFVMKALDNEPIPSGVSGVGPLPNRLLEALEEGAGDSCVELLLRFGTIEDPDARVARLLEHRAEEPWTPEVLGRLTLWSTDPLRAAECARRIGAHHAPLDLGWLDRVPPTMRMSVLDEVAGVADTEPELLDMILLRPGQQVDSHPLDDLDPPLRDRLWARVQRDCTHSRPEVARRSLWALVGRPEFEDALIAAHAHPSRNVKLYANRLLRRHAAAEVWLGQCTKLLSETDPSVLRPMARILAGRKHRPAVRVLVGMLDRSRTRSLAEQALQLFGPEAIPELEQMLARLRPDRRARVQSVIDGLGN